MEEVKGCKRRLEIENVQISQQYKTSSCNKAALGPQTEKAMTVKRVCERGCSLVCTHTHTHTHTCARAHLIQVALDKDKRSMQRAELTRLLKESLTPISQKYSIQGLLYNKCTRALAFENLFQD
jgi:hypothetical protein